MQIVKLEDKYISDVVDVHMKSFPNFFLTFLGKSFLTNFYKSFLEDEAGIGFVAIEGCKVLGAVVGPVVPDGYFKRLVQRKWLSFAFSSVGAVLRDPKVIGRLFRAVFYRGDSPVDGPKYSLLSSIAVSPEAQGRGVGAALLTAFLDDAKARGSEGCYLTTDREGNDSVNRFYSNFGWKLADHFETHEGRKMNRYVYDFADKV